MFLFVRVLFHGAQGKNREPGLQKNSVRNFIGRRALLGEPFEKPRESVVFLYLIISPYILGGRFI